jgi:hypothetical protein
MIMVMIMDNGEMNPLAARIRGGDAAVCYTPRLGKHKPAKPLTANMPRRLRSCDLEGCGNWPGQRQDPWKYIDASSPPRRELHLSYLHD